MVTILCTEANRQAGRRSDVAAMACGQGHGYSMGCTLRITVTLLEHLTPGNRKGSQNIDMNHRKAPPNILCLCTLGVYVA